MISGSYKDREQFRRQLYGAAASSAAVAGVFFFLMLVVLGLRYYRYAHIMPVQEDVLAELRIRMAGAPGDETLLETYREIDLQSRMLRVRWYEFASRAGYILLLNLAVLLAGAKAACKLRERLPSPGPEVKYAGFYARTSALSRRTVAAAFVLIGGATVLMALFGPGVRYFEADIGADPGAGAVEADFPGRDEIAENWPRFRGPSGLGAGMYDNIPAGWDIETGENILWKSPVPLPGQNSPVVWGGKVFLTGASATRRQVYCYDAETGELLWTGDVPETVVRASEIELNPDTGYAPSTAYTDGRRVYAMFPTGDVAAFDYSGRRQWLVNLGAPDNIYGQAASLVGHENSVIIQYDNGEADDGQSALIALDWRSGETLWRSPRPVASSWTTPVIIETERGVQLITSGEPYLIAYDPSDGSEIWRAGFMSGEIAPSPIYDGGLVMAVSPYVVMAAVEPHGSGEIDESYIRWRIDRGIPDITTPASDGERVYLLGTYGGALAVHRIDDGAMVWQRMLGGEFYSSPGIAAGRVYLFSVEGVGYILEAGDEFVRIGEYPLGEGVYASPAFSDGRIYIRGEKHLFCIGYSE